MTYQIWEAWESGARMDSKGISGDIYGRPENRNCKRNKNVQTQVIEGGKKPSTNARWAINSPTKKQ